MVTVKSIFDFFLVAAAGQFPIGYCSCFCSMTDMKEKALISFAIMSRL